MAATCCCPRTRQEPHLTSLLLSFHPPPAADILETQVDPACWEIAGHIVLKRQEDYEAVSQESAWRLLELASCGEARFGEVARIALQGLI